MESICHLSSDVPHSPRQADKGDSEDLEKRASAHFSISSPFIIDRSSFVISGVPRSLKPEPPYLMNVRTAIYRDTIAVRTSVWVCHRVRAGGAGSLNRWDGAVRSSSSRRRDRNASELPSGIETRPRCSECCRTARTDAVAFRFGRCRVLRSVLHG